MEEKINDAMRVYEIEAIHNEFLAVTPSWLVSFNKLFYSYLIKNGFKLVQPAIPMSVNTNIEDVKMDIVSPLQKERDKLQGLLIKLGDSLIWTDNELKKAKGKITHLQKKRDELKEWKEQAINEIADLKAQLARKEEEISPLENKQFCQTMIKNKEMKYAKEPDDRMEMPCQCDCGNWFDLNDGCNSQRKHGKVICEDCSNTENEEIQREEEINNLKQDLEEAEYTVVSCRKRLAELGVTDYAIIINHNPENNR